MEGSTIQNFDVSSLIGSGGIGSVYLARHRIIERSVAIKVLHPAFCQDEKMVARFLNEARLAHAVRHPNIVEIFDVGALQDGRPFIVMEYLEGEPLSARLARVGRMAWPDAYAIAAQVAEGLTSAHARRIVHRDIKPDNIFLMKTPDQRTTPGGSSRGPAALEGGERVKLLDFGIAKLRDELAGSAMDTRDAVLGSPLYMSPEQCRGMSDQIDQRTDIYCFGVLLYQMLTGTPPFVSNSFGDVLMMHVAHKPRPPRAIEPSIPAGVEQAILRAMAKKPEERFDSAAALMAALSRDRPRARDWRTRVPLLPDLRWSAFVKGPGLWTLVGLVASLAAAPLALERWNRAGAEAATLVPTIETLPSQPRRGATPAIPAANATPLPEALPAPVDGTEEPLRALADNAGLAHEPGASEQPAPPARLAPAPPAVRYKSRRPRRRLDAAASPRREPQPAPARVQTSKW